MFLPRSNANPNREIYSLHFHHYIDKHVVSTCYIPGIVLDVGGMKKIQFFSKGLQSREWFNERLFQSHL